MKVSHMADSQTHGREGSTRESKEVKSSREDNAKKRSRKQKRKYCVFQNNSDRWAVSQKGMTVVLLVLYWGEGTLGRKSSAYVFSILTMVNLPFYR